MPDGRIRVYYSAHNGSAMYYRTARAPEDITAWDAPRTMPTNMSGPYGFTYPNPIRLSAERKTYLFWRGGNYNPTFATQPDGSQSWSAAANLVLVSGQRPYVKYAPKGGDTIGFAFTNAHPAALSDINIYYAAYRGGSLYRADGTRIGPLGTPISPSQASKVYDTASKAWVHDLAFDGNGRPVVVFAAFPTATDHRYMYARWTGTKWFTSEITPAGGSISLDGKEPYYSGGITLDHEDPSTVYLSRDVGGVFQVETWKTGDGGASWTKQDVSAPDTVNNLRPISPRGLIPFSGDLSVVWVRGIYNSYVDYKTSITTVLASGGNSAPVADAERSPRTGPAPQAVDFDAPSSRDFDGSIASWSWDFGDNTQGSGARVSHTYTAPGSYFPILTVTDDAGARDVFVSEVVVAASAAPTASTGAASAISPSAATLHASVNPRNQPTTYRFEYGPTTAYGSTTASQSVTPADNAAHAVSAAVTGLAENTGYHYRVTATNATGTTIGADQTFTTAPPVPSAYRSAVLGTARLLAYWRLGESGGSTAVDETAASSGSYTGGVTLGGAGALVGDPDRSAQFDGVSGEMTASTPAPAAGGTLEGWFDWRGGIAMFRDNTSGGGWILGYDNGGALWYRAGGTGFHTRPPTPPAPGACRPT